MKFDDIPPWAYFVGFILLINFPQLLIIIIVFAIIFFTIRTLSQDKNSPIKDLRDLFNQEFGDSFASSKKPKKEKIITLNKKSNKSDFSFSNTMKDFPTGKAIVGGIIGLLFLFIIVDGIVSVPAGHVAVIFDRGRGVLEAPRREGISLKIPFWQEATLFTTKEQVFGMTGEFDGVVDADAVRGRSKDGQDVVADVSVTYQINGMDAPKLRSNFLDERGYRNTIVYLAARSEVYDAIGQFNALELISEGRSAFIEQIRENLGEVYGSKDIQLREVFVRKITFSPEFASAIEDKQIAEQQIITARNQKLRAEELKEKTIIEAEAEAESIRLKGETLRENPEVIQLQFVEKMAPQISWGILPDGALPLINLEQMQNQ
jgi:regulator of protease activity HflC (stomatin/prohibitin superfamily)